VAKERKAFHGLCAVFVRAASETGPIRLIAESPGLPPVTLNLKAAPSTAKDQ
jgi:hypothetical protein